ncbi:NADH_oxidase [Hexamita inflata]|uniref:NADH oxidase n=1 Tax=Hexamita inflata TaxID=28002 RepID=A0AA86RNG7_9EUKA|nr:NADH oxidase [Hexamita inflata]
MLLRIGSLNGTQTKYQSQEFNTPQFKILQSTNTCYIQKIPMQINIKQDIVCIIGGTHAGAMAAISLRNLDSNIRIQLFEKESNVAFLNCGIHLGISKICSNMQNLFYNSQETLKNMGIEVFNNTFVEQINFKQHELKTTNTQTKELNWFRYSKLIIASGSSPTIPQVIDGIDYSKSNVDQIRQNLKRVFVCKSYEDALRITSLPKPKKVLILGAGHTGMELAWSFQSIGTRVTVLDRGDHMLGKYLDSEYVQILEEECKSHDVEMIMRARVIKMAEVVYGVVVTVEKLVEDAIKTLQIVFDYVIIATGSKPNTEKFIQQSDKKLIHNNGSIAVNQRQQTSIQDVYAAGDCATCYNGMLKKQEYIPLASNAVRQGIVAAHQILGQQLKSCGTNHSWGMQLFDYSIGSTGWSYEQAMHQNSQVGRVVYSDFLWNKYCEKMVTKVVQKEELNSQFNILGDLVRKLADLVVESFDVQLEQSQDDLVSIILVFDQETQKILGCQVMGKQDITQIVNAASVAMQMGIKIQDLAYFDLGGFSGETKAWGILQMAAASVNIEVPDFEEDEF